MAKNFWQVFLNKYCHLEKTRKKERAIITDKTQKKEKPHEQSIILLQPENRLITKIFLIKGLNRLSVKTFQVEQVPLIWLQVVWESYSTGLTIRGSASEKNTQVEQISSIRRQLVLLNYSKGTISPDTGRASLRNLICLPFLFRSQLTIKKSTI